MGKIKRRIVLVDLNYQDNPVKRRVTLFLPNLGIDSIYTNLKYKYPDLNLYVVDGALNNLDNSQTKEDILKLDPEIIGFSTTYVNLKNALVISKALKRENPNIITVLGGSGANSLRVLGKQQNVKSLDYCVVGDGERAFEEIIRLGEKQSQTRYIKDTITNLDSLEFPRRECFNIKEYIKINQETIREKERYLNIYTSKGCDWAKCIYCTVSKQYRMRTPQRIKEELEYLLQKFKITKLFIVDDNFFSYRNPSRIYQICNIFKIYAGLNWETETRVMDFAKDINLGKKILKKMKQSRCSGIVWGVESGDDEVLKNLHKGVKTKDIETTIRLATEAGITSRLFIMYNLPGESEKSLDNTLNFLKLIFSKYNVNLIRVSEYVNIPGSIGWKSRFKKGNVSAAYLKTFKKTLAEISLDNNIIMNYFKYS